MNDDVARAWASRKVLVTGAGGFIGSHLVELLVEAGADVRALAHYNARSDAGCLQAAPAAVRAAVDLRFGDVVDPRCVRELVAGCDGVFHLAALIGIPYSYRAPDAYVRVNIGGTLNVLEACRDMGVERMVHASTSEVYGSAQYAPIDEKHPVVGQSPYSASKIGADKLVQSYHRAYGLPAVTVRPFNTFGPRQSARAVIPTVASQALSGREVRLGNLDPTRDLTFVTDTCRGFALIGACDRAVGEEVNLGTGEEVSIGALASRIVELAGSGANIVQDPERMRPAGSEVERLISDNGRAMEWAGWSPRVSLDEGLARTLEWVGANPGLFGNLEYRV